MTPRGMRMWKTLAPEARPPGPRPCAKDEQRRTLWLVARVWHRHGRGKGEGRLCAALEGRVQRRRVREVLSALKRRRRRIERRRAEERRVHVTVHARDVLWVQDATHLGRSPEPVAPVVEATEGHVSSPDAGAAWSDVGLEDPGVSSTTRLVAVQGEVIKDVASTRLLDVRVGRPSTGQDIVAMLEDLRVTRGLPLVYGTDNGSPYVCALVQDWLCAHMVVHLPSLPHTPQHNAFAERAIGELKQDSGLGKGVVLRDDDEARARVERSRCRIDARPRASRGGLTAAELDESLPPWDRAVSREAFWREACAAIEQGLMSAASKRERRMRTREAVLATMERFGLATRTRGEARRLAVKAEVNS